MAGDPLRARRPAARPRGGAVEEFPAAETLDRLTPGPAPTSSLPELNGAQRQRRLIDAGRDPAEVYAECVRETHATYLEETVR